MYMLNPWELKEFQPKDLVVSLPMSYSFDYTYTSIIYIIGQCTHVVKYLLSVIIVMVIAICKCCQRSSKGKKNVRSWIAGSSETVFELKSVSTESLDKPKEKKLHRQ